MQVAYAFLTGPLAWIAFILFFAGIAYRLIRMFVSINRSEKFIYSYMSLKYSLRSISHWIIPFGTVNWRRHPILTIVTFVFHLCLVLTPIFLLSHVILWDEAFDISWWTFPDVLSDIMTFIVICGAIFFFIRRLVRPEVKYVTDISDFIILIIVAAPFITGFMAYHQWFAYRFFFMFHIFSGEVMLVAIPFTRLSHMIFSPFTRAYMGSEFGKVRCARDW
jgi:nitrate reductase gamma subunit